MNTEQRKMKSVLFVRFVVVMAMFLLASAIALGQKETPPAGGQPKPFVFPATEDYTLPNGMKVTLVQYGSVPKVAVQAVIYTGTKDDAKGKKAAPQKPPKGQLDGIVVLDGGELLISSWEGKAIYRGKPGGEWKAVVEGVESPADIGWDSKRKRALIPLFIGNSVILQPLE